MAQLAVVLLALFGQMERTYMLERAAHGRAVATTKGRRIGRPVLVDPTKLAYAAHLRDTGHTIAEIITKTGIPRTSLYRHLPPRPPEQLTAAPPARPPDHQAPLDQPAPEDSHAARPSRTKPSRRPQTSSSRPWTGPTATGHRARPAPCRPSAYGSSGCDAGAYLSL